MRPLKVEAMVWSQGSKPRPDLRSVFRRSIDDLTWSAVMVGATRTIMSLTMLPVMRSASCLPAAAEDGGAVLAVMRPASAPKLADKPWPVRR